MNELKIITNHELQEQTDDRVRGDMLRLNRAYTKADEKRVKRAIEAQEKKLEEEKTVLADVGLEMLLALRSNYNLLAEMLEQFAEVADEPEKSELIKQALKYSQQDLACDERLRKKKSRALTRAKLMSDKSTALFRIQRCYTLLRRFTKVCVVLPFPYLPYSLLPHSLQLTM